MEREALDSLEKNFLVKNKENEIKSYIFQLSYKKTLTNIRHS